MMCACVFGLVLDEDVSVFEYSVLRGVYWLASIPYLKAVHQVRVVGHGDGGLDRVRPFEYHVADDEGVNILALLAQYSLPSRFGHFELRVGDGDFAGVKPDPPSFVRHPLDGEHLAMKVEVNTDSLLVIHVHE